MHFTFPAYVGRRALSARRLSPWIIRLSCRLSFFVRLFCFFGISSWLGTLKWWFHTADFPLKLSEGIDKEMVQRRLGNRQLFTMRGCGKYGGVFSYTFLPHGTISL